MKRLLYLKEKGINWTKFKTSCSRWTGSITTGTSAPLLHHFIYLLRLHSSPWVWTYHYQWINLRVFPEQRPPNCLPTDALYSLWVPEIPFPPPTTDFCYRTADCSTRKMQKIWKLDAADASHGGQKSPIWSTRLPGRSRKRQEENGGAEAAFYMAWSENWLFCCGRNHVTQPTHRLCLLRDEN